LGRAEAVVIIPRRHRPGRSPQETFFEDAFAHFDGRSHRREGNRLELSRVPGAIRARDRQIGAGAVVLPRYERVCFDKEEIEGPPPAALIAPGHPLLEGSSTSSPSGTASY
jgi:hypothetical protein